jgi:2'-5' RNA ligase
VVTGPSAEPVRTGRRGGLIVPVPEAEATFAALPSPCVPIWQQGMPAHVTLLFPFHTRDALDAAALADLTGLFAGLPTLRATFEDVGQFPDVLYLRPEPRAWFAYLTQALARRFGLPPYGGLHRDIVPHLTVTRHADPAVLATVGAALRPALPIVTHIREAWLMEEEPDGRWHRTATFALGGWQRLRSSTSCSGR